MGANAWLTTFCRPSYVRGSFVLPWWSWRRQLHRARTRKVGGSSLGKLRRKYWRQRVICWCLWLASMALIGFAWHRLSNQELVPYCHLSLCSCEKCRLRFHPWTYWYAIPSLKSFQPPSLAHYLCLSLQTSLSTTISESCAYSAFPTSPQMCVSELSQPLVLTIS